MFGYLVTFLVSVALAAFGLHCIRLYLASHSDIQPANNYLQKRENGQQLRNQEMSREIVEIEIQDLEKALNRLTKYQATPARDAKIRGYENDLRTWKNKLEKYLQGTMETNVITLLGNPVSGTNDKKLEEGVSVIQGEASSSGNKSDLLIGNHRGQAIKGRIDDMLAEEGVIKIFVKATIDHDLGAMFCWAFNIFLEILILILVLYLRPGNPNGNKVIYNYPR
ncbi:MAG: hypothetical protein IPG76_00285 [Acidobacteria bacterium]|nr:hypothetical protein [Acidobacteriota bacterium]